MKKIPVSAHARARAPLRRCLCLALLSLAAALPGLPAQEASRTPAEYRRPPDQTFLTFPEWFLVFSPKEYGEYLRAHSPEGFPYLAHVGEFWSSYAAVTRTIVARGYSFNFSYHVMVLVIGASTTVEYAIKRSYGTLVGRLAALTRSHGMTEEEELGARVAREYAEFIHVRPWYEFDFGRRLVDLWTGTRFWGPDLIRKWERKYALTTEYTVKALYAWIIKTATHTTYGVASSETAVVLDHLPAARDEELPELEVLQRFPDGAVLVTVPRYAPFTHYAEYLSRKGVGFDEIAGNRGALLLSALVPRDWSPGEDGYQPLFSQPLIAQPDRKRVALVTQVSSLSAVLGELDTPSVEIEHIFDY